MCEQVCYIVGTTKLWNCLRGKIRCEPQAWFSDFPSLSKRVSEFMQRHQRKTKVGKAHVLVLGTTQ